MEDLSFFAATDIGKTRQKNQDSLGTYHPIRQGLADSLFIVCDGMGAHKAGEVASKLAVEEIARSYLALVEQQKPSESLATAIRQAHQKIIAQANQNQDLHDMGTTVVAAAIRKGILHVGNVGDSRAYILRGAALRQITSDHSQINEMVKAGVLSEGEALNSKHRNVLSRSLSALRPSVQVDVFEEQFADGDLLLLCTDGLWGQVPENTIVSILQKYPLEKAARHLIDLANQAGGVDNVSIVIVRKGKQLTQRKAFNAGQWFSEHPLLVTAIIGILIALFALLALAVWLFGSLI